MTNGLRPTSAAVSLFRLCRAPLLVAGEAALTQSQYAIPPPALGPATVGPLASCGPISWRLPGVKLGEPLGGRDLQSKSGQPAGLLPFQLGLDLI